MVTESYKAKEGHTGEAQVSLRFPVMIEYSKSRFKTNSQLVRDENHRYAIERR